VSGSVAAILLAAGKSRRMGSCKQLLPLGETTVIGRCLNTLVNGGVSEIVVVVSPDGDDVAKAALVYPVLVVTNSTVEGDMASSVRVGRDALPADTSGVIVALCDYPRVMPATVTLLLESHAAQPHRIIIPNHGGRLGHPVLVPRLILEELQGNLTLKDLVRRNPDRLLCIEVADPGVLMDMDTPEDYRRLCSMAEMP
jgi:molybdenum cofactor cytidylyltransferase